MLAGARRLLSAAAAQQRCRPVNLAGGRSAHSRAMQAVPDVAPRTIWAVGKNYVAHIQELSTVLDAISADIPEEPLIFIKSGGTLLLPPTGQSCAQTQEEVAALPLQPLPLPVHWSDDVQHEVELAVELGPGLQPVRAAVCLDMTARDAQVGCWAERPARGTPGPWARASLPPPPIGATFPVESESDLQGLNIQLQVNGSMRQSSNTSLMIFKVEELVQYLKSRFPIEAGDLILTGTPEGVGRLQPGDVVRASIARGPQVLSAAAWCCTAAPVLPELPRRQALQGPS
ncbi:hypothetical protein V8C86DRAFT_245890 [Haematococcus lacustris]